MPISSYIRISDVMNNITKCYKDNTFLKMLQNLFFIFFDSTCNTKTAHSKNKLFFTKISFVGEFEMLNAWWAGSALESRMGCSTIVKKTVFAGWTWFKRLIRRGFSFELLAWFTQNVLVFQKLSCCQSFPQFPVFFEDIQLNAEPAYFTFRTTAFLLFKCLTFGTGIERSGRVRLINKTMNTPTKREAFRKKQFIFGLHFFSKT